MNEFDISRIDGDGQILLELELTKSFYVVFKLHTKYNTFGTFCKGFLDSLQSLSQKSILYYTLIFDEFREISGFDDDIFVLFLQRYLNEKRYLYYASIAEDWYMENNKNNKR